MLLTESVFTTRQDRERTAEIMFEIFKCQTLAVQDEVSLSMLNYGVTTGVAVNIGHEISTAVPMVDGTCTQSHVWH